MDYIKDLAVTPEDIKRGAKQEEELMKCLYWHRRYNVLSHLMSRFTPEELDSIIEYENDIKYIPSLKDNPQWVETLPEYDGKKIIQ